MKLSTLQYTLSELGIEPTRSLGQNFLHDQNLAAWIVAQAELAPGDGWLEIGPGLGALTEVAARTSARGVLIEKDDRIIAWLREHFPHLSLTHGDAVEWDTRELWVSGIEKILGNLPYYVSSQILFNFIREPTPVTRMIFTLQKELAQRLAAGPRTKEYGALTVLIGRRWRVKYLRSMPPSVFIPVPKVDSAAVRLDRRKSDELPECDERLFTRLVKMGFSQRRKQMRKLLSDAIPDWAGLISHLDVPDSVRAEELSLEQWIALTNFAGPRPVGPMAASGASGAQDVHGEMFDVVDTSNHVIGSASRHEVHTSGLLHRAVHIFVFNSAGELFLQKRSQWKDVHPGRWDSSAAGHVNSGDTADETAPRELNEELGASAPLALLGEIAACEATGWEFVYLYTARHEGPFRLPPAEIECGEWFTIDQIHRWVGGRPQDFATGFLECWQVWLMRQDD